MPEKALAKQILARAKAYERQAKLSAATDPTLLALQEEQGAWLRAQVEAHDFPHRDQIGVAAERAALEIALRAIGERDWLCELRDRLLQSYAAPGAPKDLIERLDRQIACFTGEEAKLRNAIPSEGEASVSGAQYREFLRWLRQKGWRRKVPRLFTERLILREWREQDRAAFHRLNQDPQVMRYFPQLLSTRESDAFLERIMESFVREGFGLWLVEEKSSGDFLGFTGLIVPRFQARFTPCVEIGWRFLPKAWGKGFATEAASAVLLHGFTALRLEEIVSFTVPANERSWRLMERLGMSREASEDFLHPNLDPAHALALHRLYRLRAHDFTPVLSATWDP